MIQPYKKHLILLVEDDPSDQTLIHIAVQEARINVDLIIFDNAKQALQYLQKNVENTSGKPHRLPDLILLDLKIPEMNGFQLLEELRKDKSLLPIPILILTISNNPEDVQRAYSLGANAFIHKPGMFKDFINVFKKLDRFWLQLIKLPNAGNG